MAGEVYKWIVFLLALLLSGGGAVDLILYTYGHETISTWLRDNPMWFVVPVCVFSAFLIWLGLHLAFQGGTE